MGGGGVLNEPQRCKPCNLPNMLVTEQNRIYMTAVSYNLIDVVTADKLTMWYVNKQDRLCIPNVKVLIPCSIAYSSLSLVRSLLPHCWSAVLWVFRWTASEWQRPTCPQELCPWRFLTARTLLSPNSCSWLNTPSSAANLGRQITS